MSWACQSLQCAIFYDGMATAPDALGPWMKLFGQSPQSFTQNAPGLPPGAMAQGAVGEYAVQISAQLGRIDVILSAQDVNLTFGAGSPPTIQDAKAAIALLTDYAGKTIPAAGCNRIGMVGNFQRVFTTYGDAIAFLRGCVPTLNIPDHARDVALQVNVRKAVGSLGEVNRLCRWSASELQALYLQVAPNGLPVPATSVPTPIASLMVDINTVPSPSPARISDTGGVLAGLADEVLGIMSNGYDYLVA